MSSDSWKTLAAVTMPTKQQILHEIRRKQKLSSGVWVAGTALSIGLLVLAVLLFWYVPSVRRRLPAAPPPVANPPTSCSSITADAVKATPQHACNPLCQGLHEQCVFTSTSGDPKCALSCPAMCKNVPMNKMCVKGHTFDACMVQVPTGLSTSILLQSATPAADGTTLAVTAVNTDPCSAPTFELQPAQLQNTRQHFTVLARKGKLCEVDANSKTNSVCDGKTCPCGELLAVDFYKPGQYGTNKAPFSCPSSMVNPFACASGSGLGLRVPCINGYYVLVTADSNAAGKGWALQASETLVSSTSTAAPKAVQDPKTAAWRELQGEPAHLYMPSVNEEFPIQGRRIVDSSFDRCEAARAVQLANISGKLLFQQEAAGTSAASTWNVIPVRMPWQQLLNSFCNVTTKQPVIKPLHPPFDIKNMCCTDKTCKCARSSTS
jgi:hypothetical protein